MAAGEAEPTPEEAFDDRLTWIAGFFESFADEELPDEEMQKLARTDMDLYELLDELAEQYEVSQEDMWFFRLWLFDEKDVREDYVFRVTTLLQQHARGAEGDIEQWVDLVIEQQLHDDDFWPDLYEHYAIPPTTHWPASRLEGAPPPRTPRPHDSPRSPGLSKWEHGFGSPRGKPTAERVKQLKQGLSPPRQRQEGRPRLMSLSMPGEELGNLEEGSGAVLPTSPHDWTASSKEGRIKEDDQPLTLMIPKNELADDSMRSTHAGASQKDKPSPLDQGALGEVAESEGTGGPRTGTREEAGGEDARGAADEDARGAADEDAGGVAEESARGAADEDARGADDEDARGAAEESARGVAEESARGGAEEDVGELAEESARGAAKEDAKRVADESARGVVEESARGAAEEHQRGLADESARGVAEEEDSRAQMTASGGSALAQQEDLKRRVTELLGKGSSQPDASGAAETREPLSQTPPRRGSGQESRNGEFGPAVSTREHSTEQIVGRKSSVSKAQSTRSAGSSAKAPAPAPAPAPASSEAGKKRKREPQSSADAPTKKKPSKAKSAPAEKNKKEEQKVQDRPMWGIEWCRGKEGAGRAIPTPLFECKETEVMEAKLQPEFKLLYQYETEPRSRNGVYPLMSSVPAKSFLVRIEGQRYSSLTEYKAAKGDPSSDGGRAVFVDESTGGVIEVESWARYINRAVASEYPRHPKYDSVAGLANVEVRIEEGQAFLVTTRLVHPGKELLLAPIPDRAEFAFYKAGVSTSVSRNEEQRLVGPRVVHDMIVQKDAFSAFWGVVACPLCDSRDERHFSGVDDFFAHVTKAHSRVLLPCSRNALENPEAGGPFMYDDRLFRNMIAALRPAFAFAPSEMQPPPPAANLVPPQPAFAPTPAP
eukprot:Hpha_TRINITY_DN11625_c0_g3::TRINITY_DN11625_c0_g3_i1::g.49404::m.49404